MRAGLLTGSQTGAANRSEGMVDRVEAQSNGPAADLAGSALTVTGQSNTRPTVERLAIRTRFRTGGFSDSVEGI